MLHSNKAILRPCRVCVWLSDGMHAYITDLDIAYEFARDAFYRHGLSVSIDTQVQDTLSPLPCANLFNQTGCI